MAVTCTSYFSNAIVGQPQVGADFDVYEQHTPPRYAIGLGFERSDGSRFRYVHFGTGLNTGIVVSTDISESSLASATNKIVAPGTAAAIAFEVPKAGEIGSHYIQATLTASANQYAGGYLHIYGNTGAGYTYRVRGNTATDDPVSGDMRFQLYEPLHEAVNETSDIIITGSPYANVEAAVTASDGIVAGITMANVTINNNGWILTRGITLARCEGTAFLAGQPAYIGGIAGILMACPNLTVSNVMLTPQVGISCTDKVAAQTYGAFRVQFE